jgi:sorbitol-specific phosphotransferase system component IIBC
MALPYGSPLWIPAMKRKKIIPLTEQKKIDLMKRFPNLVIIERKPNYRKRPLNRPQ